MAHETKLRRRRRPGADSAAPTDLPPEDNPSLTRAARFMPWVVGIIALLVYMATMTPGMQMGDGTELAAAAHVMGVPHPTGYPLYMMLTKLWLVLTVGGEVITRTTLLNCLLMAAAAGLTSVIVRDLLVVVWRTAVSKPLLWLAALMGLLTAFLRFHWENAVVTEVYALQFLLTLVFVRIVQKMDMAGGPTRRGLLWLTVVFALAMAHHRLSVTLILPWLGIWIWAWRRQQGGSGVPPLNVEDQVDSEEKQSAAVPNAKRRDAASTLAPFRMTKSLVAIAALIVTAGAALYLYIPLRAAQQPPINWGNVTSASAFYHHVRGTEYLDRGLLKPGLGQEFDSATQIRFLSLQTFQITGDLWAQVWPFGEDIVVVPGTQKVFFTNKTSFLGLIFLVPFIWGNIQFWRYRRPAFVLVSCAIALQNVAVLYVYNISDIRDYYLFPFWAVIISLSIPLKFPAGRSGATFEHSNSTKHIVLCGIIVAALLALNYPRVNRSNELSAELLSATILPESTEIMPPGSILITDDDSETFTTWYRQHVRGDRLDVLNFAGNFVYMPWYRAFFTAEQLRDYQITLADGVAHSAQEYADQLRTAIIDKNIASRPLYTSINDPFVLSVWAQDFAIQPVDVVETTNPLFDEVTTTVLYRIQPKDQAAP